MPISRPSVSEGARKISSPIPPIAVSEFLSATETVVPTTFSMIAVSLVIRLEISLGLLTS